MLFYIVGYSGKNAVQYQLYYLFKYSFDFGLCSLHSQPMGVAMGIKFIFFHPRIRICRDPVIYHTPSSTVRLPAQSPMESCLICPARSLRAG